jgi:hypothetical protein
MSTNPAYIGPGYWASWHIKALKADTKDKKLEVARCISIDVLNFPCGFCQKDASEYIRTHPMYSYINNDDPYSMFYYTVDFHNYVNLKLRKSIGSVDHDTAIRMWNEIDICVGDCGLEEDDVDRSKRPDSTGSNDSSQIVMKSY